MEISGAQQIVINSNITQVALAGVVISSDCQLNPTAGTATIEKVGDSSGEVTTLQFHAACDGTADVNLSIGLDHVAVSDTVALDWFR